MDFRRKRRLLISLALTLVTVCGTLAFISSRVEASGHDLIVDPASLQPADAALVLGAYVEDDTPSGVLAQRLWAARQLYVGGRVHKILVSGDHGTVDYDEVNVMREWLEKRGVKPEDIFMDHAGFNTYDSMYRARDVFRCKKLVVVSQSWHLTRALFIGRSLGLDVQGVAADEPGRVGLLTQGREFFARVKAFVDCQRLREPQFLGPVIPIEGDGRQTLD